MEKLLRALAWYADTVLSICYPAPVPPVVEEEVRSGFNEMTFTQPDDEIGGSGRVDLRNTSAAPSVADGPGSVAPPADPGQPLTAGTVKEAGVAINAWLKGVSPRAEDRAYWGNLAEDLFHIAESLK